MSYRFIDANELIFYVDLKTQDVINNMDCVYVDGIKTGNQHFNLEEHDAEIRADERKKFAEWLQSNGYYVYVMSTPNGIYTDEVTVDEIISAYEKEQKGERNG